jgi:hypothetical protein
MPIELRGVKLLEKLEKEQWHIPELKGYMY